MQRYFTDQKEGNQFILNDNDLHHIVNVMRMKANDKIEVVYHQITYLCHLDNKINIIIDEEIIENNELPFELILVQALVKEEKMDFVLQKATELGVSKIIPLIMERSIVKIEAKKVDAKIKRWNTICKEASEQAKRNIIPTIDSILNINELLKIEADLKLLCSVNEKDKLIKNVLQNITNCDKIIIVVGPEGGITDKEEAVLIKNGYVAVSLGKRVLRTETAAMYITSVVNYQFMR